MHECPRVPERLKWKQLDKIMSKMFSFGFLFVDLCIAKVKETTNILTSAGNARQSRKIMRQKCDLRTLLNVIFDQNVIKFTYPFERIVN